MNTTKIWNPAIQWHNSEKVNPDTLEVDEGWRLCLQGEVLKARDEFLCAGDWRETYEPGHTVGGVDLVYRTRRRLPVDGPILVDERIRCPKCGGINCHATSCVTRTETSRVTSNVNVRTPEEFFGITTVQVNGYTTTEVRDKLCEACKLGIKSTYHQHPQGGFIHEIEGHEFYCPASRWRVQTEPLHGEKEESK